jgi:hypothetical protein
MTQGRKSRTVLTIGCALAMLAIAAAIAPAFAGAQAAVDEYELGDLPNPDNDGGGSQSGDDQGGIAPTSSSGSGTPSDPAGEPAGQTGAAGGDGGSGSGSGSGDGSGSGSGSGSGNVGGGDNGGGSAGASGSGDESEGVNLADTPTATEPVHAVDAEPSDGGGAPVLLILLAVVAAICSGVAIWRLRRNTDDSNTGVGRGAGKAAETQSL